MDRLEGGDPRKLGLVLVDRLRITRIYDHKKEWGVRFVVLNAGDRPRKRPGAISRANDRCTFEHTYQSKVNFVGGGYRD